MLDFFSSNLRSVGHLPGLPIYVDWLVQPELAKLEIRVVSSSATLNAADAQVGMPLSPSILQVGQDNFFQNLPAAFEPPSHDDSLEEHERFLKTATIEREYLIGDCYQVRNAFDRVSSVEQMIAFLRFCGPFLAPTDTHFITWESFQAWQNFFTEWRLQVKASPQRKLRAPQSTPEFSLIAGHADWTIRTQDPFGRKVVSAFIRCVTVLGAIAATVVIDKLQNVEERRCQYEHCPLPRHLFQVKSAREVKFCSRECKKKASRQRINRLARQGGDNDGQA